MSGVGGFLFFGPMCMHVCVMSFDKHTHTHTHTHNAHYTPTYFHLVQAFIRRFDKLGNYNNAMALRPAILAVRGCDRAAHLTSHHSSLCVRLRDCLLHLWLRSPGQCTCSPHNVGLFDWRLSPCVLAIFCLTVSPVSDPCMGSIKAVFPALQLYWTGGGSSLHVRCQREVFIMHFLRRLYLIWQDFIWRGQA